MTEYINQLDCNDSFHNSHMLEFFLLNWYIINIFLCLRYLNISIGLFLAALSGPNTPASWLEPPSRPQHTIGQPPHHDGHFRVTVYAANSWKTTTDSTTATATTANTRRPWRSLSSARQPLSHSSGKSFSLILPLKN